MKTGDRMQFWEVLVKVEDDTTIIVDGLDNHLRVSNPNNLGCGANAWVEVLYMDCTVDGRPLVWVRVVEDTTSIDDEEAIAAYLDALYLTWSWEKKPQEDEDSLVVWAIRKEKV